MLLRIKTPTAYAFHAWISGYPESLHPSDMSRFYVFVKTAIAYKSKRWMNNHILRKEILKKIPLFSSENLEYFSSLFNKCLEFSKAYPLRLITDTGVDSPETRGTFKEVSVKNGEIVVKLRPMNEFLKGSSLDNSLLRLCG